MFNQGLRLPQCPYKNTRKMKHIKNNSAKKAKRNRKRKAIRQQRANSWGSYGSRVSRALQGPSITLITRDMSNGAIEFREKLSAAVDSYYGSLCEAGGFEPHAFERNVMYNTLEHVLCGNGRWWVSLLVENAMEFLEHEDEWQYFAWNCSGCNYAGWFLYEITKDAIETPDNYIVLGGGEIRPKDKELIKSQFSRDFLIQWGEALFRLSNELAGQVQSSKYSEKTQAQVFSYLN